MKRMRACLAGGHGHTGEEGYRLEAGSMGGARRPSSEGALAENRAWGSMWEQVEGNRADRYAPAGSQGRGGSGPALGLAPAREGGWWGGR